VKLRFHANRERLRSRTITLIIDYDAARVLARAYSRSRESRPCRPEILDGFIGGLPLFIARAMMSAARYRLSDAAAS
jgi:hypothetical protein